MDYTVLDLEMTGLTPKRDKVIEIGAVRVRNGEIADTYGTLVRPGMSIPETVVQLTGITDEMAALGKEENVAMQELLQFIGDDILVGHNLIFDYSFLKQWAVNQKIPLELSACDTLRIARALLPGAQSKKLESLCEYFQIEREHAHRALDDAVETYKAIRKFKIPMPMCSEMSLEAVPVSRKHLWCIRQRDRPGKVAERPAFRGCGTVCRQNNITPAILTHETERCRILSNHGGHPNEKYRFALPSAACSSLFPVLSSAVQSSDADRPSDITAALSPPFFGQSRKPAKKFHPFGQLGRAIFYVSAWLR